MPDLKRHAPVEDPMVWAHRFAEDVRARPGADPLDEAVLAAWFADAMRDARRLEHRIMLAVEHRQAA
jgi:hypothetical protein